MGCWATEEDDDEAESSGAASVSTVRSTGEAANECSTVGGRDLSVVSDTRRRRDVPVYRERELDREEVPEEWDESERERDRDSAVNKACDHMGKSYSQRVGVFNFLILSPPLCLSRIRGDVHDSWHH